MPQAVAFLIVRARREGVYIRAHDVRRRAAALPFLRVFTCSTTGVVTNSTGPTRRLTSSPHRCVPCREAFTLHGLWVNYDTGKYPQFCTHDQFDESQVRILSSASGSIAT